MANWARVKADVLETVFFNFTPEEVEASSDLADDGYLDSLAIVTIVTIIDDHVGGDGAQLSAERGDFQSLATIEVLFERVRRGR
jgi:acyl carrier protein